MIPSKKSYIEQEIELHKRLAVDYKTCYREVFSRVFQAEWNRALLKMNRVATDRVLDLGCGTGILLCDLMRRSCFVVGLDLSPEMRRAAHTLSVPLVVGNGSVLPFCDASFNLVTCRGVLHHVSDIPAALSEIHRVLHPAGELILSEPCNDWWLVRTTRRFMY